MVSLKNLAILMAATVSFASAAPTSYAGESSTPGSDGSDGNTVGDNNGNNSCSTEQTAYCCNTGSETASGLLSGLKLAAGQCATPTLLGLILGGLLNSANNCDGFTAQCCAGNGNDVEQSGLININESECSNLISGLNIGL